MNLKSSVSSMGWNVISSGQDKGVLVVVSTKVSTGREVTTPPTSHSRVQVNRMELVDVEVNELGLVQCFSVSPIAPFTKRENVI